MDYILFGRYMNVYLTKAVAMWWGKVMANECLMAGFDRFPLIMCGLDDMLCGQNIVLSGKDL